MENNKKIMAEKHNALENIIKSFEKRVSNKISIPIGNANQ